MSKDDEPYVPKISEKPVPEYERRKAAAKSKRPKISQKERFKKYRRELKALNVHKPKNVTLKHHVEAIKSIKDHLRETWKTMWDNVSRYQNLTPKQIEFARQYAINGRTNKVGAMRLAGYDSANSTVLHRLATRNLALPHFYDLITAFEIEEKARMKINVEDVVKWFNDIATAAMGTGDFTNANRAMENLAKYLGMFVEKKEIIHKTIHSKEELDARIQELTSVLREVEPDLERKLRIN